MAAKIAATAAARCFLRLCPQRLRRLPPAPCGTNRALTLLRCQRRRNCRDNRGM
jgi:hypothetical protein